MKLLIILIFYALFAYYGSTATKVLIYHGSSSLEPGNESERKQIIYSAMDSLNALAKEHDNLELQFTDSAAFTSKLIDTDCVVFLMTYGDVLNNDQKGELQQFIQRGKGFVGIYTAAATETSWQWYQGFIRSQISETNPNNLFSTSGVEQREVVVADRAFPASRHLSERWRVSSHWPTLSNNVRKTAHVLATLETSDTPVMWCHSNEGKMFYTTLGSTKEIWRTSDFVRQVMNGILWAANRVQGDCAATLDSSYEKQILNTDVHQPMQMSIAKDGRVFFVERSGALKIFLPDVSQTIVAGTLPVTSDLEDGLMGIALDPNFAENNWIYLFYSPKNESVNVLSRFRMNGNDLVYESEKQLIRVLTQRQECCHSSGSLLFDESNGYLYITTGDNVSPFASQSFTPIDERPGRSAYDAQGTSGNTMDLRGKILRIKPTPEGYIIPSDNLFASDASKGRPEIYVMGARNPFRMAVDQRTHTIYFGDVGPNADADPNRGPTGVDEINQVNKAGNYGWPYCIGDNQPYRDFDFQTRESFDLFNCASPTNDSPNNYGSETLPPSMPALIWYGYQKTDKFPGIPFNDIQGRAAMVGPFYRYDPRVQQSYKLPAYFDNTLIFMEWRRGKFAEVKFDSNEKMIKINPLWDSFEWLSPIDMKISPKDGSIYILEFGVDWEGTNARVSRLRFVNENARAPICRIRASPSNGIPPLTVTFQSTGSESGDSIAWDFDSDGQVDSTEASASFIYRQLGTNTATLTVTNPFGVSVSCTTSIVVGNTEPTVTIHSPLEGGIFNWGDHISFTVSASDSQVGSTNSGTIPCSDVQVRPGLGHDNHVHSQITQRGCEGTFMTLSAGHDSSEDLFYVVEAFYQNKPTNGLPSLTGRRQIKLQNRVKQAEIFTSASPTVIRKNTADVQGGGLDVAVGERDWLCYADYNLINTDEISFRGNLLEGLDRDVTIEVRKGSMQGDRILTATIPRTASSDKYRYFNIPLQGNIWEVKDTLCFVFRAPRVDNSFKFLHLNWFQVNGIGIARVGGVEVVKAYNSGEQDVRYVTNTLGYRVAFEPDAEFKGGQVVARKVENLGNTNDMYLYQTQRVGGPSFSYDIDIPLGLYKVTFYFAETDPSITQKGQRVFTIKMENRVAFKDLDLFELTEKKEAIELTATTFVEDGFLTVDFEGTKGAAVCNAILVQRLFPNKKFRFQFPGMMEAEKYREGGKGVGFGKIMNIANWKFRDQTTNAACGRGESDPVVLSTLGNAGQDSQNCYVTLDRGEFLQYDVEFPIGNDYRFSVRVSSSDTSPKSFYIEAMNQVISETITFSTDGNRNNWVTVNVPLKGDIDLFGYQLLKVVSDSSDWHLDYVTFTSPDPEPIILKTSASYKLKAWSFFILTLFIVIACVL